MLLGACIILDLTSYKSMHVYNLHRSLPLVNVTVNFEEIEDIGVAVSEPRYREFDIVQQIYVGVVETTRLSITFFEGDNKVYFCKFCAVPRLL